MNPTEPGDLVAYIDTSKAPLILTGNTVKIVETNSAVRIRPQGGNPDGSQDIDVFAPNWSVIRSVKELTQPA